MKYAPILFCTPMVQAILDGRKTMTRRVIKDHPTSRNNLYKMVDTLNHRPYFGAGFYKNSDVFYVDGEKHIDAVYAKCRYQPGDILWVRETWSIQEDLPYDNYVYRTDYGTTEHDSFPPSMFKWRPSFFMPKAAARIFLKVTDVRCERLQEIGLGNCYAEGCPSEHERTPDIWFQELWDKLNAQRGYRWETNPWVWVYTFERTDKPEGWCAT